MWTEYTSDFDTFYKNYLENQEQFASNYGIVAKVLPLPLLTNTQGFPNLM
jgi:Chloramphenicol O-acetyltransferase